VKAPVDNRCERNKRGASRQVAEAPENGSQRRLLSELPAQ
jgi:hypothetical protein